MYHIYILVVTTKHIHSILGVMYSLSADNRKQDVVRNIPDLSSEAHITLYTHHYAKMAFSHDNVFTMQKHTKKST